MQNERVTVAPTTNDFDNSLSFVDLVAFVCTSKNEMKSNQIAFRLNFICLYYSWYLDLIFFFDFGFYFFNKQFWLYWFFFASFMPIYSNHFGEFQMNDEIRWSTIQITSNPLPFSLLSIEFKERKKKKIQIKWKLFFWFLIYLSICVCVCHRSIEIIAAYFEWNSYSP